MAVTSAGVLAPPVMAATEDGASGMDWMTMSLEARNLAFNNVAHVGSAVALKKTEEWAAASKALRAERPKHLDLAYAQADRAKWDLYPATDPRAPCYVHIHGGFLETAGKESVAFIGRGVFRGGR